MTALDPRLAPVIAAKRRSGWTAGFFGVALLLVSAFCMAGKAISDDNHGTIPFLVLCLTVFILPGVLLVRVWLRGPEQTKIIRLLTVGCASITSCKLDYVSESGGPTRSRIWLSARNGGFQVVTLGHEEAAGLIAYLAEVAPQAKAERG